MEMLIRIKYCLTGQCSQRMEKYIEAFDCAASNPGINGHGQENECENSGVVPQGGRLLHARLRGSKFICPRSNVGLRQELGPVTKSILPSGFAWPWNVTC